MDSREKVLVVGTTPDYIDWLRQTRPGKALFLTDYSQRRAAAESSPPRKEELLSCLTDENGARDDLLRHINAWDIRLDGIVCFDCESMELTASLAKTLALPYPSLESIRLCRDKYACKVLWQQNGIRCPRSRVVRNGSEVHGFTQEIGRQCVIKPLTGSGSELVFRCAGKNDCERWAQIMRRELGERDGTRLYSRKSVGFLAEEYVSGQEYSCDFVVTGQDVHVLRLTKKLPASGKFFGTIAGYALTEFPAPDFSAAELTEMLHSAASALAITDTICMVDFLVSDDGIVLLEMTPRPGGDCIPHLLRRFGQLDILSTSLDFATRQGLPSAAPVGDGSYVGVRLHAKKSGQILKFDLTRLEQDTRVREIHLIRSQGHTIKMPPADYDSWYLGHVLFQAAPGTSLEQQCREIRRELLLETSA